VDATDSSAYEYDADGRLVERRDGDKVWRFAWTVEGRLRECVSPDGGTWRYEYDAFGRRISKTGADGTATYVWDGDVIAREVRDEDAVDWVHEPASTRPLLKHAGRDTFVCVADQSGAPRELVTTAGTLAWAAALDVWGEPRQELEPRTTCPIRFQGQWSDAESGLHYNYHRYYAPDTGRYVTADPIGLDGGARVYGYVHNPLSWIDPFGLGLSGADFSNSPDLFPVTGDQKNIVQIPMQGARGRDFTQAFEESGIPRADAKGYTWHHVDDFDPTTGKTTMQLVKRSTHEASLPHKGSVAQFEEHFGVTYDTPEAVAAAQKKGWLQGRMPCPQ
jgi:RHS repeat-associated protein